MLLTTSVLSGQYVSASGGPICEKSTGGTCFIKRCKESRGNATCARATYDLSALGTSVQLPLLWWSCDCTGSLCAAVDGTCRPQSSPKSFAASFRSRSYDALMLLFVILGRSGVLSFVSQLTGLNRAWGASSPIPTHYSSLSTWEELREEQKLDKWQAFVIAVFKLSCWHMLQIVWFGLTYVAYTPLMSPRQASLALVVLVKEVLYGAILAIGIVTSPRWLLFCPLSEVDRTFTVVYFLSPDCFVADTIWMNPDTHSRVRVAVLLFAILGAMMSLASWIALGLGFIEGAMTPALATGYMLSAFSPMGLIWSHCFPRESIPRERLGSEEEQDSITLAGSTPMVQHEAGRQSAIAQGSSSALESEPSPSDQQLIEPAGNEEFDPDNRQHARSKRIVAVVEASPITELLDEQHEQPMDASLSIIGRRRSSSKIRSNQVRSSSPSGV